MCVLQIIIMDPLIYWNHPDIVKKYPKLRIVALQILSISVGAVPCERLFSALKNLIDSKSTKLTPTHNSSPLNKRFFNTILAETKNNFQ